MTNLRTLLLTIAALAILPGATARAANIAITFDSPVLFAMPGETVTFRGTITNLESVAVDLNVCAVAIGGQFTTDNCALFFAQAPFFLNPNETSAAFDMFTVTPDLLYTGTFGLQAPGSVTVRGGVETSGYDGSTQNLLAQADFSIAVTPEPGTAALLCLALFLGLAWRRARLRSEPRP